MGCGSGGVGVACRLVLAVAALSGVGSHTSATTTQLISQFGETTNHQRLRLTHMAVDRASGRVYAGANNHLYQLTANLSLERDVVTGPRNDSPLCHATGCDAAAAGATDVDVTTKLMDNVNKVII